MRLRSLICFTVFVFLALCRAVPAAPKITKESLDFNGKQRNFYLFVPENISPSKPAPLIVMYHGSGNRGSSLVERWQELAAKEGIILAGPDSIKPETWQLRGDGTDLVHKIVESLKAKHPVNARRVYLFGHSAGATFALFMSLLESKYFAATAIHAGALIEQDYPLIDYATRQIPIAIFVGTKDPFVSLAPVWATRDVLNKRGFSVRLTEIPSHDHNYYARAQEINRDVWNFLQAHELSADPSYEHYKMED